jgi:hypothetical protein
LRLAPSAATVTEIDNLFSQVLNLHSLRRTHLG